MRDITKIIPADIRCEFCKRHYARYLCDMPIGHKIVKASDRGEEDEVNYLDTEYRYVTITCGKQMCAACAVQVMDGVFFCPDCVAKVKNTSGRMYANKGQGRRRR